jgi:hypothetical protein
MIQIEASSKSLQLENWLPLPIESSYDYYYYFMKIDLIFLTMPKRRMAAVYKYT